MLWSDAANVEQFGACGAYTFDGRGKRLLSNSHMKGIGVQKHAPARIKPDMTLPEDQIAAPESAFVSGERNVVPDLLLHVAVARTFATAEQSSPAEVLPPQR